MSVGKPDTMSVEAARKAARAKLALVDQDRDPAAEQAERLEVPTIKELATDYIASAEFKTKTPKVQANDQARIKQHILHHVGSKKSDAITPQVAKRLVQSITSDTRLNSRKRKLGGPGAARKALLLLAAMLAWAKSDGTVKVTPFAPRDLNLEGDGQRDAVITSPDEYARLFSVVDTMAIEGKLRADVRAFLVLVASTGLRRGEAQGLRWGQVNLDRRQITLPKAKGSRQSRKAGKVAGVELVGLPPIAADALARIKPDHVDEAALVFVPAKGGHLSVNRDWITVRKAAGLPDELTLHGLRHSVGTVGAIAGMSMPELQALLRHKQPGTTARYLHFAQASGGLADKAMSGVLPPVDAPGDGSRRYRRE
jgi:integrase